MSFYHSKGFALPTVLITSIIMMSVLLVGLGTISSTSEALRTQYETQLNREASEAGMAKATACIKANSYTNPVTSPTLKPNTNCAGTALLSCTNASTDQRCYVSKNGNYLSSYEVTFKIDSANNISGIVSKGIVKSLRSSDSSKAQDISSASSITSVNSAFLTATGTTGATGTSGGGGGGGGGGGSTYNPAGTHTVTSFAGLYQSSGSTNATGTSARFSTPYDAAVDSSGNIFVADYNNNLVRKITSAGVVTTYASGFNHPSGVAVDSSGNVYVADTDNHKVMKINTSGVVSTFAGSSWGSSDGPVSSATIERPIDLVCVGSDVYVMQMYSTNLRRISGGNVTTISGTGKADNITADTSGNIYLANWEGYTITKVAAAPSLAVSILAGSTGSSGTTDATGSSARFNTPYGIAYDAFSDALYVTQSDGRIRKVTKTGVVTTFSGTSQGNTDGNLPSPATFNDPYSIISTGSGSMYVVQRNNHNIRKITMPAS